MEDNLLLWLGILIAIIVAGADDENRRGLRWLGIMGVGILMILFYK